jgi:hypothetical protein
MNSRVRLAGALALALWAAAACKSVTAVSDKNLLEVVERFHHDLRWKYNDQAAARVPTEQVADFLEQLEDKQNDLNITAWTVRKVEFDALAKRAQVRMHLEYYQMPSTVMQEAKVEQVWEERNKSWVCVSIAGGPIELRTEASAEADGGQAGADAEEPPPPARQTVQDLSLEGADDTF